MKKLLMIGAIAVSLIGLPQLARADHRHHRGCGHRYYRGYAQQAVYAPGYGYGYSNGYYGRPYYGGGYRSPYYGNGFGFSGISLNFGGGHHYGGHGHGGYGHGGGHHGGH